MSTTTPRRITRSNSKSGLDQANSGQTHSLWLAADPSKRWAELFFLAYSPFWILWALCILVPFQLYEYCDEWGYLTVGLLAAIPCFALPPFLPNKADKGKPWHQKFWVKMNIWVAIFSYIGNYFWTHYFFQLLGASYTMPSHRLNGIPLVMFLMTQAGDISTFFACIQTHSNDVHHSVTMCATSSTFMLKQTNLIDVYPASSHWGYCVSAKQSACLRH